MLTRAAMFRSIVTLVTLSLFFACGPNTAELTDDGYGETASELTLSSAAAAQLLAVVNYPGTGLATLDEKLGLDARAAQNIILYRNGLDGRCPSVDDNFFESIGELDAIPYVGDAALTRLLAYAGSNPPPSSVVVEGVTYQGWQAEIVVWALNKVEIGVLNGLLDNRAAANVMAARPFTTVTQVGQVALIGPNALEAFRGQARTWWHARANTTVASLAGTFDGVTFDQATAVKALELANTKPAAELIARGVYSAGANAMVANRPLQTLTAVAALSGVGTASMQALEKWAKEPVSAIPEVKAALETAIAGAWMPSETDARFVFLAGTQLNGAAITADVIRAQLTDQHDAQLGNVMWVDADQRSLAAKTFVEERDAFAMIDRLVGNADPEDEVSLANAAKLSALKTALQTHLTDVKVVRFGTVSISTFFVGRTRTGELVALLTGQVET